MYIGRKRAVLIVLVVIAFTAAMYFTYKSEKCGTVECFRDKMLVCEKASYINEEPEASWSYEIQGVNRNTKRCDIEVILLQAKEGELAVADFEGDSMVCSYPFGIYAYPDKDLSLCTGKLKEDIQGRIIEKLHEYLLDNLVQIEDELKRAVEGTG